MRRRRMPQRTTAASSSSSHRRNRHRGGSGGGGGRRARRGGRRTRGVGTRPGGSWGCSSSSAADPSEGSEVDSKLLARRHGEKSASLDWVESHLSVGRQQRPTDAAILRGGVRAPPATAAAACGGRGGDIPR